MLNNVVNQPENSTSYATDVVEERILLILTQLKLLMRSSGAPLVQLTKMKDETAISSAVYESLLDKVTTLKESVIKISTILQQRVETILLYCNARNMVSNNEINKIVNTEHLIENVYQSVQVSYNALCGFNFELSVDTFVRTSAKLDDCANSTTELHRSLIRR